MIIYVGCDHAGLELKLQVMQALPDIVWKDMGTFSADSVDYPDFADKVCNSITQVEIENAKLNIKDSLKGSALGLLICGSGQGMAIRANRYPQVRAALCWNEEIVQLSREHNNANILAMGARFVPVEKAVQMINVFLKTEFAGGRHENRIAKLSANRNC